jgi:hypothetical protein
MAIGTVVVRVITKHQELRTYFQTMFHPHLTSLEQVLFLLSMCARCPNRKFIVAVSEIEVIENFKSRCFRSYNDISAKSITL